MTLHVLIAKFIANAAQSNCERSSMIRSDSASSSAKISKLLYISIYGLMKHYYR